MCHRGPGALREVSVAAVKLGLALDCQSPSADDQMTMSVGGQGGDVLARLLGDEETACAALASEQDHLSDGVGREDAVRTTPSGGAQNRSAASVGTSGPAAWTVKNWRRLMDALMKFLHGRTHRPAHTAQGGGHRQALS